jgi:hypothetical protein
MKITNEAQGLEAPEVDKVFINNNMVMDLDDKYKTISILTKEKPEFKTMTPSQFLRRVRAHENILIEMEILQGTNSIS